MARRHPHQAQFTKKPGGHRRYNPDANADKVVRGNFLWQQLISRGLLLNAKTVQRKPLFVGIRNAIRGVL